MNKVGAASDGVGPDAAAHVVIQRPRETGVEDEPI
jgi:hypothetical protein